MKMPRRPRVLAQHDQGGFVFNTDAAPVYVSPAVKVKVEFDLHDHERALRSLDEAVAEVRAQIEEATPATPPRNVP